MKNPSAGAKRVLVVEDEPSITEVCLRTLNREGFEVDTAANGVEAEDKIRGKDYDLVLIDIKTPEMNGKDLYHYITEKHPSLVNRVVFTTGDTMSGDTQSFLRQSGRPFLPKPFTPDELIKIVTENLRH